MIFMLLMCMFSFMCLVVSLLALAIVLKNTQISNSSENEKTTSKEEAILITGCDSGIGLELAKYVLESTHYTVICCCLSTASVGYKELKQAASREVGRLCPMKLDITSADEIAAMELGKCLGKIKSLVAIVNNAGTLVYGEFDWLTWNQIESQIEVNLLGTLRLTRAVLPYIIESKGRIINISSVNDTTVFPGLSIYSASKSALSTFSRGLGYELRKFGVSVVTLRLGDFARLTNIMASHEANRDKMWKEMDQKKRNLYGDYLHDFHNHILKNYGMTSPKKFSDSNLFHDFRRALLSKRPPNTITCASLAFRIFYFIIELLPISIQYLLLDQLLQFSFKWDPQKFVVTPNSPDSASTSDSVSLIDGE